MERYANTKHVPGPLMDIFRRAYQMDPSGTEINLMSLQYGGNRTAEDNSVRGVDWAAVLSDLKSDRATHALVCLEDNTPGGRAFRRDR